MNPTRRNMFVHEYNQLLRRCRITLKCIYDYVGVSLEVQNHLNFEYQFSCIPLRTFVDFSITYTFSSALGEGSWDYTSLESEFKGS